jgi:hypothetical protein
MSHQSLFLDQERYPSNQIHMLHLVDGLALSLEVLLIRQQLLL